MDDRIRVFLSADGNKHSVLKFSRPPNLDLNSITKAVIKDERLFNVDDIEIDHGPANLSSQAKKNLRKLKEERDKMMEIKNKSLILETQDECSKRYNCKKENGALENICYFILRKVQNGYTISPIDNWYNLMPTIAYRTLNEDEAESEFGKRDHVDSNYSNMIKRKLGILNEENTAIQTKEISTQPPPKKRRVTKPKKTNIDAETKQDDSDPDAVEYDFYNSSESDEETPDALPEDNKKMTGRDLCDTSSDEDNDLTESGKELKKILEKSKGENSSFSTRDSDDDISDDNIDDIDELEKKYSKSKIFTTKNELSTSAQADLTLSGPVESQPRQLKPSESTPNLSANNLLSTQKIIEEKVRRYLSHKPMNIVLLLKKLLAHAPPGVTREQVVFYMANILKKIGSQKKVIGGQTYIELLKK